MGYITNIYYDEEKQYYLSEQADEIIGYEALEIKDFGKTLCKDTKLVADEFLKRNIDIDLSKYHVSESILNGNYKYNYIEYINGYKTANQVSIEVDKYGNIISYIHHEQQLPESWSELSIKEQPIKEQAKQMLLYLIAYNYSYKLESFDFEDLYLVSNNNKDFIICKIKAGVMNEKGEFSEDTLYIQIRN